MQALEKDILLINKLPEDMKVIVLLINSSPHGYGDALFGVNLKSYIDMLIKKLALEDKLSCIACYDSYCLTRLDEIDCAIEHANAGMLQTLVTPSQILSVFQGPLQDADHPYDFICWPGFAHAPPPVFFIGEYDIEPSGFEATDAWNMVGIEPIRTRSGLHKDSAGILLPPQGALALIEPSALPDFLEPHIYTTSQRKTKQKERGELSFGYLRDSDYRSMQSTERFLRTVTLLATPETPQRVVLVGGDLETKKQALERLKSELIAEGYTNIVFFDEDSKTNQVLHRTDTQPEKCFHVIWQSKVTPSEMVALSKFSDFVTGTTGDQSLGLAISLGLFPVYECLEHKKELAKALNSELLSHIGPIMHPYLAELLKAHTKEQFETLKKDMPQGFIPRLKAACHTLRDTQRQKELAQTLFCSSIPIDLLEEIVLAENYTPNVHVANLALPSPLQRLIENNCFKAAVKFVVHASADEKTKTNVAEILERMQTKGIGDQLPKQLRKLLDIDFPRSIDSKAYDSIDSPDTLDVFLSQHSFSKPFL